MDSGLLWLRDQTTVVPQCVIRRAAETHRQGQGSETQRRTCWVSILRTALQTQSQGHRLTDTHLQDCTVRWSDVVTHTLTEPAIYNATKLSQTALRMAPHRWPRGCSAGTETRSVKWPHSHRWSDCMADTFSQWGREGRNKGDDEMKCGDTGREMAGRAQRV